MKNTLQRSAASIVVAGVLAFGTPAAANAYTPPTPDAPVVDGTIVAGGSVTISFSGFVPGEPVTVSLTGEFALSATIGSIVRTAIETNTTSLTAAADGSVAPTITLPDNAMGTYTVTATGADNVQTASFTVAGGGDNVAPGAATDDGLAATGADPGAITALLVGGGALVLAGGAVVVATAVRRRQNTDT